MNRLPAWEKAIGSVLSDWQIRCFDSVDSTMDVAAAISIKEGGSMPLLVIARSQSFGRGRMSRRWHEAVSGLYASAVFCSERPPSEFEGASLVVGCALRAALSEHPIFLKWPNDLITSSGAKLGGILLELSGHGGKQFLNVGIGLNLEGEPETDRQTASIHSLSGIKLSPLESAAAIFPVLRAYLLRFEREDFSSFRDEWLSGAKGLGSPISVNTGSQVQRGVFTGIDQRGRLLLSTDQGLLEVSSGEMVV